LTVNHPGAIPLGNQWVNVTVLSSGSPLEDALVCLRKGSETYASGYTNGSGFVSLNVEPLTPGFMDIVVTAQNHYPYQDSIIVQASNYAYVTYLKCAISDPGGNNDGKLNPGESAEIPLWVKNWGQSSGVGVTGTLSESDGYVTLADTVKSFGTVLPEDSAYTGSDGYDCTVASSCPDGHSVLFTLTCKDNVDSIWVSQFSCLVYAPVLGYVDVAVTNDGNGNGILDPDESADLVVTLENTGGATATGITSTLTTSSSYITINDGSGNFPDIDPGNSASNTADPYNVYADAGTPTGTVANFEVVVSYFGIYTDTFDFSIVVGKKQYYIWNPDPTPTPGSNCHSILTSLGYSGDYGTSLAADLTLYQAVLVFVGIYSDNYLIAGGGAQATALEDFLQNHGGRMYLEGGDVWYWDPLYSGGHDFGPLFGINATSDGSGDLMPVAGQTGTFTVGMNFSGYTGENSYIDHISPTGTGFLIFQNTSPTYDCGVANDAGTYRTVGTSFEIGLLTDATPPSTRAALLDSIMKFFGIVLNPGVEEGGMVGLPVRTMMSAMYPNPAAQRMVINYQVAAAMPVQVKIYDAAGRLVRGLASGIHEPGYYRLVWDGCYNAGCEGSAGVYFVHMDFNDTTTTEKAVLVR